MNTLLVAALALIAFAAPAAAQTPQSVIELMKNGYDIISISPISGSYAVFLENDEEAVVICQIGIDAAGTAFSTDKCYPLAK